MNTEQLELVHLIRFVSAWPPEVLHFFRSLRYTRFLSWRILHINSRNKMNRGERRRDITEESFRIADEERIFHTYKSSAMIMTYIIIMNVIGVDDVQLEIGRRSPFFVLFLV